MEISHPRRILAVSLPDSGLPDLLQGLTGSTPTPSNNSIAGVTHNWAVKTAYYSTQVPIWLDEIIEPSVWSQEFLSPEAREVLTAVGAFIVCFRKPITEDDFKGIKLLLESVGEVVKEGCGFTWDGVCLAVAMPQSITPSLQKNADEWEDVCQDSGFEFVDFEAKGRNEFSEPMGLQRLKEALEANEWEGGDELGDMNFDDFDIDADDEEEITAGFGMDAAEIEKEMAGMKRAIYGNGQEDEDEGDQDEEVEKLQVMMQKMQAVRDMGADLPEAERKKLAAKAVSEIMKTL